jgi:uncharacterized paraquat-inducible protein A
MKILDDFDVAIMSSISAFVLAQISSVVEEGSVMSIVTGITAVTFCITSVIKMVNYIMESLDKWKRRKK